MTEIDERLQEMAKTDWKKFMEIIGEDSILIAKSRLLRKEGKSYQQISLKIGTTISQVRHACNKDAKK